MFFSILISIVFDVFRPNEKNIVKNVFVVVLCVSMILLVPSLMKMEYDEATKQNVFPIIIENINEQTRFYVVISEGKEKYSSYLCNLKEEDGKDSLIILTDKQKYFDINTTETFNIKFDNIRRIDSDIYTIKDFLNIIQKTD